MQASEKTSLEEEVMKWKLKMQAEKTGLGTEGADQMGLDAELAETAEKPRLEVSAVQARLEAEAAEKASTGKKSPATVWQGHHGQTSHLPSSKRSVFMCFNS